MATCARTTVESCNALSDTTSTVVVENAVRGRLGFAQLGIEGWGKWHSEALSR